MPFTIRRHVVNRLLRGVASSPWARERRDDRRTISTFQSPLVGGVHLVSVPIDRTTGLTFHKVSIPSRGGGGKCKRCRGVAAAGDGLPPYPNQVYRSLDIPARVGAW